MSQLHLPHGREQTRSKGKRRREDGGGGRRQFIDVSEDEGDEHGDGYDARRWSGGRYGHDSGAGRGGGGYASDESDIIDDLSEMIMRQREAQGGSSSLIVDPDSYATAATSAAAGGESGGGGEGEGDDDDSAPILVDDDFMRDMEAAEEMPEDRMLKYLEDKLGITRHRQYMRERGRMQQAEDDSDGEGHGASAAKQRGKRQSELQKFVEDKRRKKQMERERDRQLRGKRKAEEEMVVEDDDGGDSEEEVVENDDGGDSEEEVVEDNDGGDSEEEVALGEDDVHSDAPSYEAEGDGLDDLLADLEDMEQGTFSEDSLSDGAESEHMVDDEYEDSDGDNGDSDVNEDGEASDADSLSGSSPLVSLPAQSDATLANTTGKYIPPSLRRKMLEQQQQLQQHQQQNQQQSTKERLLSNRQNDPVYQALEKKIKVCINKLSETNMMGLVQEALKIYGANSKNYFHEILTGSILNAICDGVNLMSQFVLVYAGFVVALHNIGAMEVGAYFIEKLVQRFDRERIAGDRQRATNMLWMMCHLYNLKMIYSGIMFDLVKVLLLTSTSSSENENTGNNDEAVGNMISELNIELILKLLRTSGFQMRSDDPAALKDTILDVQAKVQNIRSQLNKGKKNADPSQKQIGMRLTFMLDTLNDIKINKQRQNTQAEMEKVAKMLALVRLIQKRSNKSGDFTLRIPYKDALMSNKKGRWWLVGSAWAGIQYKPDIDSNANGTTSTKGQGDLPDDEKADDNEFRHVTSSIKGKDLSRLEKLASEQRMNTDLRRSIFYILMSSEDYIDASQQLSKLGLAKHDREIVRVLMHCCCQEKTFNPYYHVLSSKLCGMEKRLVRTFQFVFFEHFKQLASYPVRKVINLSHLLSCMILSETLHLSILKVVDFTDLGSMELLFFRLLFMRLLLTDGSDKEMQRLHHEGKGNDCEKGDLKSATLFMRMVRNPSCESLKEGLTLFLYQFRKKQFRRQFVYDLLSVMNVNRRNDRKWLKAQEVLLRKRVKKADKVMRLIAIEREEGMLDADQREFDNDDNTLFTD